MLSKIGKQALRAAFSTVSKTTPPTSATVSQINVQSQGSGIQTQNLSSTDLQQVRDISSVENLHFNDYINEIKGKVANQIGINFESNTILDSPVGQNNWKLVELITLGGAFKFVGLLAGFPSYASIVGVLGVTGLGAALSYSNLLRRSAPQITQINLTKEGKFHIVYLKPGYYARQQTEFQVQAKNFSFASFGCQWTNYLRKCNNTSWVSVEGNLFWYNNDPSSVRINSQLFSKLF